MSNLTDFFPSGGGGGLTPKFEEFNSSGTFTPTQALIDAGGYIEVFLVAGGGGGGLQDGIPGGFGGEVKIKKMNLTSITGCSVIIGSGGGANDPYGINGGNSVFSGASAGGVDITCNGGKGGGSNAFAVNANPSLSPNWPAKPANAGATAGNGVFGYGAGGAANADSQTQSYGGMGTGSSNSTYANSGHGGISAASIYYTKGGSGYCLIKWYE